MKCRKCGAPIFFARTTKGRRNPINVQPVPNGNVIIEPSPDPRDEPMAHTTPRPPEPGEVRYTSHFSNCPAAEQFRRVAR